MPVDRLWSVPPLFRGETLAILASGPSMSQDVANQVRGRCRVLAINDNYLLAPWCDVHYHCDMKWWDWARSGQHPAQTRFGKPAAMAKVFNELRAIRITLDNSARAQEDIPSVKVLGNASFQRPKLLGSISRDRRFICTGGNSGFQCLNIAYHLEPKRVLLLGYNMSATNDRDCHWFGQHPVKTSPTIFLRTFIKHFDTAAPALRDKGIEVINCTEGSALKCFPFRPLGECLA